MNTNGKLPEGDRMRPTHVDDLVATGGSAKAAVELIESLGGEVVGVVFLIELTDLKGVEQLEGHDVFSLIKF